MLTAAFVGGASSPEALVMAFEEALTYTEKRNVLLDAQRRYPGSSQVETMKNALRRDYAVDYLFDAKHDHLG